MKFVWFHLVVALASLAVVKSDGNNLSYKQLEKNDNEALDIDDIINDQPILHSRRRLKRHLEIDVNGNGEIELEPEHGISGQGGVARERPLGRVRRAKEPKAKEKRKKKKKNRRGRTTLAPPPESLNDDDVDARGRFIDINFEDIEDDIEGLLGGLGLDADVSFEFGGRGHKEKSKEKSKEKGHKEKKKEKSSKEKSKEHSHSQEDSDSNSHSSEEENSHELEIDNNVVSGQIFRLRGSSNVWEGRIEVWSGSQWNSICVDIMSDHAAALLCHKLGFPGGMVALTEGSVYRTEPVEGQIDHVECPNNAVDLNQCILAQTGVGCYRTQGLRCQANTGCPGGWESYDGLCYKVFFNKYNFEAALRTCERLGTHLVSVQNQKENDFVSDLLFSKQYRGDKKYWSGGMREVRTGGGRQFYEVMVWKGTPHPFEFLKWFPGFPPYGVGFEPNKGDGDDCVMLATEYELEGYDLQQTTYDVGYYFWADTDCDTMLPFVCQRQALPSETDCYTGDGADYRGNATRTEKGTKCISWETPELSVNAVSHPNQIRDDAFKVCSTSDVQKGKA